MVIGAQEEIAYCSSGTSSGKQKKARSTSQARVSSENTSSTVEAEQIWLALQQLAINSNSGNFNSNVNRFAKLSKSFSTTMPIFDGKSEETKLSEALFQTNSKIHNHFKDDDKIIYFQSIMRGDALPTFKKIASLKRENLAEFRFVFRTKYLKPQ